MEKPDTDERENARSSWRQDLGSSRLSSTAATAEDRRSEMAASRKEVEKEVEKLDEHADHRPKGEALGQRPRKAEGPEAAPLEGRKGCEERERQRQEVTRMTPEQWKSFMKEMSQACAKRFDLMGTCVRRALLHAPPAGAEALDNNMQLRPQFFGTWLWVQSRRRKNMAT